MLSQHCVVGVALGDGFTLAVIDAGAVFSFGQSVHGALSQGYSMSEVLPRRVKALAATGLRFVAVAAGNCYSLALTEEGLVYGWGGLLANGHGQSHDQNTPQLVAALAGEQVIKLVYARGCSENSEIYIWSDFPNSFQGDATLQKTPTRVEALRRVKVRRAAVCGTHALVADVDGVVWAFGIADALPGRSVGQLIAPSQIFACGPSNRHLTYTASDRRRTMFA